MKYGETCWACNGRGKVVIRDFAGRNPRVEKCRACEDRRILDEHDIREHAEQAERLRRALQPEPKE